MRSIRWLLLLAALAFVPDEAMAQGLVPRPDDSGYETAREIINSRLRRLRRPRTVVGFLSPGAYGLGPIDPFDRRPPFLRLRIYVSPPQPPPVIVLAPPFPESSSRPPMDDPSIPPVPGPEIAPPPEIPRVRPMPRVPEKPPAPPMPMPPVPPLKDEPKDPPKNETPKPVPGKERREAKLPRPPAAADDPRDEHARLVERGEESFKDLEYGRAAQRFRQAILLLPKEPLPHFLLAQALLAQGKYHEANDAILAGMRLQPNWPTAKFRPLELYGVAVAEYPEHLAMLEETRRRFPNDPVLLFLSAYQLWFDGRREEARPLLHRALLHSADRDVIDRFLRALPAEEL